jgi:hypothetical protein
MGLSHAPILLIFAFGLDLARAIDVARAKGLERVWVERDGRIVLGIAKLTADQEPEQKVQPVATNTQSLSG